MWTKTTGGGFMQLCYAGKTLRPLHDCSFHSHDTWELVYNEKGTGTIEFDAASFSFCEGSIFLYSPDIPHRKYSDQVFEDYYIRFSNLDMAPGIYSFTDAGDQRFFLLIRLLYLCYCDNGEDPVCSNLLSALESVIKNQLMSGIPVDRHAQLLRQQIIDHYPDPEFRIQTAMRAIPLNKDYLRRRFKAAYGMTPQDYLLQLRLENAKNLLSQVNGFSVSDAAYLSGFYDPQYFSRAFKKYTGNAPSVWQHK